MRNMNIYAELAVENVEAYQRDAVEAVKALYDSMLCGNEGFIIFDTDGVTFTRKQPENAVILEEGFGDRYQREKYYVRLFNPEWNTMLKE